MNRFVSPSALATANIPADLLEAWEVRTGSTKEGKDKDFVAATSVCLLASEVIKNGDTGMPAWTNSETRFLVIRDVPVPATMKLPTLLSLRKPDQRLFLTDDLTSVRRWMLSIFREPPFEGIIGAYLLGNSLIAFLGDLTIREFPTPQVPSLCSFSRDELLKFEVDVDGSFLHWPAHDVHLGPSQLLQAVDPAQLADIEIDRYRTENTAAALKHMREGRGLTQSDIQGLSERQVSRLENGRSRLTADAAEKWALSFDMELPSFLRELGGLLSYWKNEVATEEDHSDVVDTTVN